MSHYTYALIDGVLHQNAIKELYKSKQPIQVIPLYMGTRFEANHDLGPILVAALEGSTLIDTLKDTWTESVTLIHSDHYLREVATHLSQFITVTDETGSNALFRFADPVVTWYWLNSYEQNALPDILGPISAWQIQRPKADWQTEQAQWDTYTNPNTAPLQFQINYLNEPQTKALDEAADFRFKNQQYNLLIEKANNPFQDKTEQQITDWLDQVIAGAEANYLNTERGVGIWVDLAADYGQDFLTQPQGEYQTWLAENLQHKPLPLEVKLETYYKQLYNI